MNPKSRLNQSKLGQAQAFDSRKPIAFYTQADRDVIFAHPAVATARKRSRVLAVQIHEPGGFMVETDRGMMTGHPGDWLVTNHPDDDPTSDIWSISNERFRSTYVVDVSKIATEVELSKDAHKVTVHLDVIPVRSSSRTLSATASTALCARCMDPMHWGVCGAPIGVPEFATCDCRNDIISEAPNNG